MMVAMIIPAMMLMLMLMRLMMVVMMMFSGYNVEGVDITAVADYDDSVSKSI